MEPKRRRSEPSETSPKPFPRDFFDEIFKRHDGETEAPQNGSPIVRSSWLVNVNWISSKESSAGLPDGVDTDYQSEMKHMSQQLLQVKRRLGPAAEMAVETSNCPTTTRIEFEEARRACNPYEVLGEGQHAGLNNRLFMNRSAIKLANVDAALNFCLVQNENIRDTLVFADLCGAPGGFSEYILWRSHSLGLPFCRGIGMSLVGANEQGHGLRWKLHDTVHQVNGSCSRYSLCHGVDGSGDIYNWGNVQCLLQTIVSDNLPHETHAERRAHLVVADGGFDAQRDADNQEQVAQKLVVCETGAALALLRQGGTLVIKMFGFQSPVIRAVMRHLFFAFDSLVAIKPISSRPASAERYVVCFGFRGLSAGWDGQKWCSDMFLGRAPALTNGLPLCTDDELGLFRYLNEFDRDMCCLNLKACFSILSYLESKCIENSSEDSRDQMMVDQFEAPRVNIASYKFAWQLT